MTLRRQTSSIGTVLALLLFLFQVMVLFVVADDVQTVFVSGDTWTCFGNELECSGFFGGANSLVSASHGVQLNAPSGQTISTTQNVTYQIVVRNTGNSPDTFTLSLLSGGATAALNQTSVALTNGTNATVLLVVGSSTAGNFTTQVNAVSNADATATSQVTVVTTVLSGPAILSSFVTPRYLTIGDTATLGLTAVNAANASVIIASPNGTTTTIFLVTGMNSTYAGTSAVGIYNVTFTVNDTFNTSVTSVSSFEVFPAMLFNTTITDTNQTALNTTIQFIYNGTVLHTDYTDNGTYVNQTIASIIDLGIGAYNASVVLHGINVTLESGKIFGVDRPALSGYVTAYAFQNNFSFTNATLTIGYAGTGYSDERYLKFYVCHDYNFTGKSCNAAFEDITSASTQSFVDKTFTTVVTGFSAFAVRQETPPTTPAPLPEVSGGCSHRIDCGEWSAACESGTRTRQCKYTATCDGTSWVYKEVRACSMGGQPIPASPFQMVGFLDISRSQMPVGGFVQAKVNVMTPDEDALVNFVYMIDGQDILQDTSEQRLVNKSDSFYTNISTGNLPPGAYNLTIKARYAGEQAVLKEQFTLLAAPVSPPVNDVPKIITNDAVPETTPLSPVAEQPAAEQPSRVGAGVLETVGQALSTIGTVVATPFRALYRGFIAMSGAMLLLLIVALIMPFGYLVVRTRKLKLHHAPRAPVPAAQPTTTAPIMKLFHKNNVGVIKERAATIKQATDYRSVLAEYQSLHAEFNALKTEEQTQVYQDILLAQEHLEQLYFDGMLTLLSQQVSADPQAAVTTYEQLSQHSERMTIEQYQRLTELSHTLAERAGIKSATTQQSPQQ